MIGLRRLGIFLVVVVAVGALSASSAAVSTLAKPIITMHPTEWTQDRDATFVFSSTDAGATFLCRFDGSTPATCTSPASLTQLAEGPHSFQVRATDGAANISAASGFDWTVDVTPPSPPGSVTAEATSPLGATVVLTAADNLDPAPQVECSPPSGSMFPLGTTTVTCGSVDAAGNERPAVALSVTVRDTTPPVVSPHADVVAAQQSASGAMVAYRLPVVSDAADPNPAVDCGPAPGSVFPVGDTVVGCTATDAGGNRSAEVDFKVIVQQGQIPAKPVLMTETRRITSKTRAVFGFTVEQGAAISCKLDRDETHGSFLPCSTSTSQTYTGLTEGSYLFTVRVTNSIGNVNQATYGWKVDLTPPAPVASFRTRAGDGWVMLLWTKPTELDYARVRISRKRAGTTSWRHLADRVSATSLKDDAVRNDVRYRYRIRSIDKARNASAAVGAIGRPSKILSPAFGAELGTPPLVDWRSVADAAYYNVQVWRNGRKILSVWPLRSRYQMRWRWTYRGRSYALTTGGYHVYVWPGFGSKASADYGRLLGWTSFRMN